MKKILLVADFEGWIFQRHCQEIKKRLSEYHIDIVYHRGDVPTISKGYDCIYVLDPMPMNYPPPNKTILGLRNEFLYREHPNGAKGLYEQGFPGKCVSLKDKCCILHVVNKNLLNVFKNIVSDKPLLLVQHGVDEDIFDRSKYAIEKHLELIVGVSGRGSRNKGFGLVQQACQELGLKMVSAEYGNRLNKEQMPNFYKEIGVHVCMSKNEGENNPIMEAGAMGVPVISTRCGHSEEVIQNGVNGFLIERNVGSLKEALTILMDSELRSRMGDELYKEIMENWTWEKKISEFRNMFNLFFKG